MPRFDVKKGQNKNVAKASFGNDLLRKEIALPHGFGVALQKFVPRAWTTIGSDIESVTLQNSLHRISRNRFDTEFPEFAEYSGVSPSIVLCQFQDELLDLFRCNNYSFSN